MLPDSRQRPPGVIAAAVIAILGSLVSLLFGVAMSLSGAAVRTSAAARPPDQPLPSVAVIAIMAIMYVAFGAWGVASAVGLLRLKNWARLCFLIFGGLLAFISISTAAGSMIAALALPGTGTTPFPPNVTPALFKGVAVIFAVMSLIGLAIASWWLVYFNRSSVRAEFGTAADAARPQQFPLAITIIAWLLISGSAIGAVEMLTPYPLLLFGIELRGLPASLALAVFAAVGLTAGIGMLKKRVEAHSLAVGYFGFGVLNVLSYFVVPGTLARMEDIYRETQGNQALPAAAVNSIMGFALLVGLVGCSALLLLLIRGRRPFVDACQAQVE